MKYSRMREGKIFKPSRKKYRPKQHKTQVQKQPFTEQADLDERTLSVSYKYTFKMKVKILVINKD